jgi:hypothetical protein
MRKNMNIILTDNEKADACAAAYKDAADVIVNAMATAETAIRAARGKAAMILAIDAAEIAIRKAKAETIAKIEAISKAGL